MPVQHLLGYHPSDCGAHFQSFCDEGVDDSDEAYAWKLYTTEAIAAQDDDYAQSLQGVYPLVLSDYQAALKFAAEERRVIAPDAVNSR